MYIKGRGSQIKVANRFNLQEYVTDHIEGLDETMISERPQTEVFQESPNKVVNKVDSPDVGMDYSLNPYQGCEHGCVYCYARPTHEFWGYEAGLDFETKIVVKKNAPQLLEKHLLQKNWKPKPIVLSGNTDCYQPLERKLKITQKLLKVFLKYRHPVGIITKNDLILRDLDILKALAADNLVRVIFSVTTLQEKLRSIMEPRTTSARKKLMAIAKLSHAGIPVSIMNAPIIPGINHHEIPSMIKIAADNGARDAGYTMVRLNGKIGEVFHHWLVTNFPDRHQKVWNQICEVHGGIVSSSEFGKRMRGSGNIADIIKQLFTYARNRYMPDHGNIELNTTLFRRGGNYQIFS